MEKQRTKLNNIAAKKFLCRYELKLGAKVVGTLMCLVMLACIIACIVQALGLNDCKSCSYNSWKHAYSLSISAAVYCFILLCVNLWFLWGVYKEKSSVILSWVVITAVWLAQTICLLIVLIIQYSSEAAFVAWVICLCLAILCIGILLYCLLVGYGYWLELKNKGNQEQ
ncbi:uncharacterized protein LOC128674190 [Plodia interpunctella]|uniref:uncharacterized protein LOC128674190 n=1 Tax=Plodia interpunctella TaxID=58824 RepID=UPI0023679A44|nr:uncharacterized protein LOC128674190 [Plodia interpunctella]